METHIKMPPRRPSSLAECSRDENGNVFYDTDAGRVYVTCKINGLMPVLMSLSRKHS